MVNPHRLRQYGHVNKSKTVRRRGDRRDGRLFPSVSISQPEGTGGAKTLRLSPAMDPGQK